MLAQSLRGVRFIVVERDINTVSTRSLHGRTIQDRKETDSGARRFTPADSARLLTHVAARGRASFLRRTSASGERSVGWVDCGCLWQYVIGREESCVNGQ